MIEEQRYRSLKKNEVIKAGDDIDRCCDPLRDDAIWQPVHEDDIGRVAPDPQYPSHRQYRRKIEK